MQPMRLCDRNIHVQGRLLRIAHIDGEKYRFLDDPEAIISGLKRSKSRIDLFTFMQRLPETTPKYNYPMEWDNFAALPLSTFDHWWKAIGFKARNKAKQAEKKGVVVREVAFDDALLQGICEIYNETPIRQGRRFAHYGIDLGKARRYAGTFLESSFFIGAFLGDRLIGFAKLTMDETRTQAGLMHILSMLEHRDKAPTNALIAQAVRSCAERHISYLVYSNFAYANKQPDTLCAFKESNGFERIDVPRYYVPLSPLGRFAVRYGLHHGFLRYLPEPAMAKLRDLRGIWYRYKVRAQLATQ